MVCHLFTLVNIAIRKPLSIWAQASNFIYGQQRIYLMAWATITMQESKTSKKISQQKHCSYAVIGLLPPHAWRPIKLEEIGQLW